MIGAVDGKLVTIHRPFEQGNSYIDRKQHTSLSLLVVADARCRFTYVKTGHSGNEELQFVGCQHLMVCFNLILGRNHDHRVFTNSALYYKMLVDHER